MSSTTQALIDRLAADTRPVRANAAARRLAATLLGGGLVAMLLLALVRGVPPFQALPVTGWLGLSVKQGYALSMAAIAGALALRAGRPGVRVGARAGWLLVPFAGVLALAVHEQLGAPPDNRAGLVMGTTWQTCLASTVLLGSLVLAALLRGFGALAPPRPAWAGFLAGVAAGAVGCAAYALFCRETAASFLITWYTLGMLVAGGLGALLGARRLRW